jgi:nitrogen fixation NifU-like protein
MESVYKTVLLDHFHNPRNKGELGGMDRVKRGSNPRCGDDIEIGVSQQSDGQLSVWFRGRGCSVCLASASMMSESITGLNEQQSSQLTEQVLHWFVDANAAPPANTTLAALDAVRQHPARKKCVLLAWKALNEILCDLKTTAN